MVRELPKPVREMIGEVVAATKTSLGLSTLHYLCAPPDEMLETLWEMSQTQEQMALKYPMIGLYEDITINAGRGDAFYGTTSLNLIIATATLPGYKSAERETASFEPVLRPIFHEFKEQLKQHSKYFLNAREDFPMDWAERKRWGRDKIVTPDGKTLGDHIDAIDIMNLELQLRYAPATAPFRNA